MRAEHEQAYLEYVEGRIPVWRRTAYLLCQDWHGADDLVQVAAIRLYVHWRLACRADNLDAYAQTILVRVFLQERRSAWSRRVVPVGQFPERADVTCDHSVRLQVRSLLAQLAPRQRAAVVLRFYCDLSIEQTADLLGCSPGTVKSQTKRGLDTLRRALVVNERVDNNG